MNSRLEALISAYQVKPKKIRKKLARGLRKSPSSIKSYGDNPTALKPSISNYIKKKPNRESNSVQPKRSDSNLSLSKYLNTSLDEDIEKLDNLTVKNSTARLDWISVKQRMIELSVKKKLNPIQEIDESTEIGYFQDVYQGSNEIINKNEHRINYDFKDRIKSLDNLLLID
jgi:hypothetical protein